MNADQEMDRENEWVQEEDCKVLAHSTKKYRYNRGITKILYNYLLAYLYLFLKWASCESYDNACVVWSKYLTLKEIVRNLIASRIETRAIPLTS